MMKTKLGITSFIALWSVACGDTHTRGSVLETGDALSCERVTNYTAALGEATIRCLGTFDAETYRLDEKGFLQPNFQSCTQRGAGEALRDIQDLLSLQVHEADLPARRCMVNSYTEWATAFRADGNRACPTWNVVSSRGAPSEEAVRKLTTRFDFARMLEGEVDGAEVLKEMHHDFVYDVSFRDELANQPCGDALSCATSCAAAFPGWHVGTEEGRFVGDPSWWVGDQYPSGANPFLAPGYYHPMSFEKPAPGALYGHRNRRGEACSKYVTSTIHYTVGLIVVCLDPANGLGCMSKCAGPAVNVYGTVDAD